MSDLSVRGVRKKRRRHSTAFKAKIVSACRAPGVSVAEVALAHRLNANLVRKWIRLAEAASGNVSTPSFIPVALPGPVQATRPGPGLECIRLSIPTPAGAVGVDWPLAQADRCLALLRELLR